MKVYHISPDDVPLPVYEYTTRSYANVRSMNDALERDYRKRLKDYLVSNGYTGEHTGKSYRVPVADGAAEYMVMDKGGKLTLALIELGDAYRLPAHMTRGIRKADVLRAIEGEEHANERFGGRYKESKLSAVQSLPLFEVVQQITIERRFRVHSTTAKRAEKYLRNVLACSENCVSRKTVSVKQVK